MLFFLVDLLEVEKVCLRVRLLPTESVAQKSMCDAIVCLVHFKNDQALRTIFHHLKVLQYRTAPDVGRFQFFEMNQCLIEFKRSCGGCLWGFPVASNSH